MLTFETFSKIMNKNRSESPKENKEDVTCTNGTSKEVLSFLKTLNDPITMKQNVEDLEMSMNFSDIQYKKA